MDVTGIEPVTPCLQSRLGKNTKCFVWCRLHEKSARLPLFQMSRSCPERSEPGCDQEWEIPRYPHGGMRETSARSQLRNFVGNRHHDEKKCGPELNG